MYKYVYIYALKFVSASCCRSSKVDFAAYCAKMPSSCPTSYLASPLIGACSRQYGIDREYIRCNMCNRQQGINRQHQEATYI